MWSESRRENLIVPFPHGFGGRARRASLLKKLRRNAELSHVQKYLHVCALTALSTMTAIGNLLPTSHAGGGRGASLLHQERNLGQGQEVSATIAGQDEPHLSHTMHRRSLHMKPRASRLADPLLSPEDPRILINTSSKQRIKHSERKPCRTDAFSSLCSNPRTANNREREREKKNHKGTWRKQSYKK